VTARKALKGLALGLGAALALVVIALAVRLWDNGRIRVHSAEQAVEMAKAEAGLQVASLPVRVEPEQDFWIVRFGPDRNGQMHNYLVAIWDKRAHPLLAEVTTAIAIEKPR